MVQQKIVKQEVEFAVQVENGVVVQIGKNFIYHPKISFAGKEIHWLEEKTRKEME